MIRFRTRRQARGNNRLANPHRKLWLQNLEDRSVPATITVTGTGDTVAADGLCTLREAINSLTAGADANADVTAN